MVRKKGMERMVRRRERMTRFIEILISIRQIRLIYGLEGTD